MTKYKAKTPDASGHIDFTKEENETWKILIERQLHIIEHRACPEFLEGLAHLNLPLNHIPQCHDINQVLQRTTGWSVVPVAAIIPLSQFFQLLANKQFPAASFIRVREELDYLQEPDIFHEFFGHCPLLTNQAYADFTEHYGKLGLAADEEDRIMLGRLFWFTNEFGLINTAKGLRTYGGGILSSKNETIYCIESDIPERKPFDVIQVLRTPYRI